MEAILAQSSQFTLEETKAANSPPMFMLVNV